MKKIVTAAAVLLICGGVVSAEVSDKVLDSISTPNKVKTSIGTLKFLDGAPYPETAEKVYDYLDTMRGVDVFLKCIPAASLHELVKGNQHVSGGEAHQIVIFDKLMDAKTLFLTANSSTMYIFPCLDLERDGPTVVEAPPAMQGMINDAWFRYVTDIGPAGPDKGKGGKYLVLPPGYEGVVPDGYFVVRPRTYEHWLLLRTSIKDGLAVAEKRVKDHLKVYPLSKAKNPPKMEWVTGSGVAYNTVHANDYTFYEHVDEVIQKEPLDAIDVETRGLLASIGIQKGKPFAPDARMKRILTDAVAIGNAAARTTVWHPRVDGTLEGLELYPGKNSKWMMVHGCDARHGAHHSGSRVGLRHRIRRWKQPAFRRVEAVSAPPASESPGRRFLGTDGLRHPDTLDARYKPAKPDRRQPDQGNQGERGRLIRYLLRAQSARRV
jgi:hypothetical protein